MTGGGFPFDALAERAQRSELCSMDRALEAVEEAFDALEWRHGFAPTRGRVLRLARLLISPGKRHLRKRVPVTVEDITLMGGWNGDMRIPSITVTCTECQMTAEAYGRSEESITYACASLAEECGDWHFYEPDDRLL